jgi:hypothetical protein
MSDLPSKIIIITLFVVTTPGCARLAQDEAAYLDYASRRCADDRRNFKQWAADSPQSDQELTVFSPLSSNDGKSDGDVIEKRIGERRQNASSIRYEYRTPQGDVTCEEFYTLVARENAKCGGCIKASSYAMIN